MALLKTTSIPMGTPCPAFDLPAVDGRNYSLADFAEAKVLVVMFICNHCPYVQAIEDRYVALAHRYQNSPVQMVGICPNDPDRYPDDNMDALRRRWIEKDYRFPYLQDITQQTARDFGAVCTPDLFVYDADRRLAYHGQLDDNWADAERVTRHDLRDAIEALLVGKSPSTAQQPAQGCSIKWR